MTDSTKDSSKTAMLQEKGAAAVQEMRLKGNQLVDKVKELIQEGNTRRVIIKKEGRTLLEFPLSVGVGGAAAALTTQPMLSAIGALAAHFADIDVAIERAPGAGPVASPAESGASASGASASGGTGASVGASTQTPAAPIGTTPPTTSTRTATPGGASNEPLH